MNIGEDGEDYSDSEDAFNLSTSVFNFSLKEALQILQEHRQSRRILRPDAEIVLIVFYSVLITSGVVSNALLCFVVARQCSRRTMSNSGPTPRNLYIVNLAIADLGLCLLVMPFTLISLLRTEWTLGVFLCKMVPVAQGTNITVSAGTISAIALDRYYTIVRSPRGQVCQMATCSVAVTITLLWTFSVLVMVPLVLYQDVEVIKIGGLVMYEVCVERWPTPLIQCIYTLSLSVLQFLVPVLVLTIIHTKISAYLSVHLISPPGPRQSICKRAKREFRRNRRTMIILSCIAIVYALSWLPMTAFTVVMELNPHALTSPQTIYLVFSVCHLVAMSSTVTNPLLYGWLNTNFRRELGSVLGREKKERTQRAQRMQYTSVHRPSVFAKDRRISFTFLTTLTTGTATTSHRGLSIHGPVSRVDHV
ncbi:neuropeptide Y receptor type 2-like [Macrosteles quadrilineatus]|uniref:neuropeptide Y receptor type 2-like n=1 Tax=Macrosteles quadrilineatus TaxID=74068 RepID=UPI0023E153ED|nr:neuropeptide Y receptor type 2-like [Macrosteles quadrilineatus]